MATALDNEVDGNFDAFCALLPGLMTVHAGKFALLRHRRIEGYFDNLRGAFDAGLAQFSDRMFSVQEVTDRPADLGFFSHAIDTRLA